MLELLLLPTAPAHTRAHTRHAKQSEPFLPLLLLLSLHAKQVQGGGNCANALTAAARLGLRPTIVSKV